MPPKISVIVPVYKVEQYLPKCIESILAQTYTDFELLLIDDGSPDNSGAICDEYAKRDTRVHVFHKLNGGVSSARNLGLVEAKGEWIAFVDSDDWIGISHFENLIKDATNSKDGIYAGGYTMVNSNNDTISKTNFEKCRVHPSDIGSIVLESPFYIFGATPWGKLFSKEIINRNSLKFDHRINSGEDSLFVLSYLLFCNWIQFSGESDYYYRRGVEGSLSIRVNEFEKDVIKFKEIDKARQLFIDRFNIDESYLQVITRDRVHCAINTINKLYLSPKATSSCHRSTEIKSFVDNNLVILFRKYSAESLFLKVQISLLKLNQFRLFDMFTYSYLKLNNLKNVVLNRK